MSAALLQLAFREKSTQRVELFLLDELTELEILTREQKIKASQIGLEIAKNTVEIKRHRSFMWNIENRTEKLQREKERYHASPALREQKKITARAWQKENRDKVRAAQKNWIASNRDKRKAALKCHFARMRERLTHEELKAYYREKNKLAIANKIARLGYGGYREQQNALHREWYKSLSSEKIELKRAQARERQRIRRETIHQSPELLAIYREKQNENQRKNRAKHKLQNKEKQC